MLTFTVKHGSLGCSRSATKGLYLIQAEEHDPELIQSRVVLTEQQLRNFIEDLQDLLKDIDNKS